MKILHITAHLGGGVGTTLLDWMETDQSHNYWVHSLDVINMRARQRMNAMGYCSYSTGKMLDDDRGKALFKWADIVVVHWWDHPLLAELIGTYLPAARMVFWAHQNYKMSGYVTHYPDRFITTSPVMGRQYDCIKSTGDISKFLNLPKRHHDGYTVGYVGTVDYKKLHPHFIPMCERVDVPGIQFHVYGENHIAPSEITKLSRFLFPGKISEVDAAYFCMDVFGYPLRPDHYGTSELVLGEAMASGIVPVCMANAAEKLIIQNGVTGYLCMSEEEYIENIEHLYHKPLLRNWMGENARAAARELYDIKRMVKEWNSVFLEMMDTQQKVERDPIGLEKL